MTSPLGRVIAGGWFLVCAILLVPAFALCAFSMFLLDAPGSGGNIGAWALALALWMAPVALIVGAKRGLAAAIDFTPRRLFAAVWPTAFVLTYGGSVIILGQTVDAVGAG